MVILPEVINPDLKSELVLEDLLLAKGFPVDLHQRIISGRIFLAQIRLLSRFLVQKYSQGDSRPLQLKIYDEPAQQSGLRDQLILVTDFSLPLDHVAEANAVLNDQQHNG